MAAHAHQGCPKGRNLVVTPGATKDFERQVDGLPVVFCSPADRRKMLSQ
jgi:hypothetical protein